MSEVPQDLNRLNELLGAIPLECGAMTIGELDGYVAGLIVSPEPVPPAEWLPTVWGGEDGFAGFEEAGGIAAAVLDHYNRIARELAEEPECYMPVMELDSPDGDLLWGPWINGFERAMRLRADAWEAIAFGEDDGAAASVSMILAMNAFDHGESELSEEEEDEIDRTAPDLIHAMVLHLTAWKTARSLHRGGLRDIAFGDLPAHGRVAAADEACPCGSGRSYGRCCGAH